MVAGNPTERAHLSPDAIRAAAVEFAGQRFPGAVGLSQQFLKQVRPAMECYILVSKLTRFSSIAERAQWLWNGILSQGFYRKARLYIRSCPASMV